MVSAPIFLLLAVNAVLFVAAVFLLEKPAGRRDTLLLGILFFCSGMPALVYQIVWQRVLFAAYGVNAESVAVVVSAFMLGLGLGGLLGGWLSERWPRQGIAFFGAGELGTALFGIASLRIFHWVAAFTAGASLGATILWSLLLLIVPTMLMGATLPLLVGHLARFSGSVGRSVATLYFVNTFGSAAACAMCAGFLLRDFGQSGSVAIAAALNLLVGAVAFLYGRSMQVRRAEAAIPAAAVASASGRMPLPLWAAMLIAGLCGFIALGFEIAWFRVFSVAASDRAPAFALLLSAYLGGVAAGSLVLEKFAGRLSSSGVLRVIGVLLVSAGALSVYLPPLVGMVVAQGIPFLWSAPAFFVVAGLMGAVLPLTCQLAVSADEKAGSRVSLVYVSNILGSALGSLGIGFVLLNHFGLRAVCVQLGAAAAVLGGAVLLLPRVAGGKPPAWTVGAAIAGLLVALAGGGSYSLLYERLVFGTQPQAGVPFAHVVENRNGMIAVTQDAVVFGGGVYDGRFNTDPTNPLNFVVRTYSLSAFAPSPRRMLMIGLSSGSWSQILVNHPDVESLDILEINPGYLQLIPQYPDVRSLLGNPKAHVHIDDARRWLVAHPGEKYDVIVANISYFWRDHTSHLLSVEFLRLIRSHLNPGGVYFFNTTESDDAVATGLSVFPYGIRVLNFLAVSDSPLVVDKQRWMAVLERYRIDGKPVFDPGHARAVLVLQAYSALADTVSYAPRYMGMEATESLRARTRDRLVFTEDNMGWEWRSADIKIEWQ